MNPFLIYSVLWSGVAFPLVALDEILTVTYVIEIEKLALKEGDT